MFKLIPVVYHVLHDDNSRPSMVVSLDNDCGLYTVLMGTNIVITSLAWLFLAAVDRHHSI